jgi:O-antigen ligase
VTAFAKFRERIRDLQAPAAVALFFCFPISMVLGNLFFILIPVLWLSGGDYQKTWSSIKVKPIAWVALALYGLIIIGVFYGSAPPKDMMLDLGKYSKLLVLVLLLKILEDEKWRQRCLNAFTFAMIGILISTFANIWLDLPWSKTKNQGLGVDHTVVGDYITQNIQMCFFALICFGRAKSATTLRPKFLWFSLALCACLSITFLSPGRTGYGLLAVILVYASVFNTTWRQRLIALCVLGVALTIIFSSSTMLRERFEIGLTEIRSDKSEVRSSVGGRLFFQKRTLALALEKPVFGWGTGSYHKEFCRNLDSKDWCDFGSWHPHNQYLLFWMGNGILGLVLFCLLLVLPPWLARHEAPDKRFLVYGFSAIFLLNSFVNCSLWSSRENHFFVFMLALLCAGYKMQRQMGADPANKITA